MTGKICYIVGAGEIKEAEFNFVNRGILIAADGGWMALNKRGINPDYVIGDMDSNLDALPSVPTEIYSSDKDETDMLLAVKKGLDLGYRTFGIYGGLGGRLDHTLANLQVLLHIANHHGQGFLIQGNQVVTVIKDQTFSLKKKESGTFSVFSLSEKSMGVCIEGAKFSLNDVVLTHDFPVGISNQFQDKPIIIKVKKGILLVMWEAEHPGNDIFDMRETIL